MPVLKDALIQRKLLFKDKLSYHNFSSYFNAESTELQPKKSILDTHRR